MLIYKCPMCKSNSATSVDHVQGSIGVVFELRKGARGDGFFVQKVLSGGAAADSGQVAEGDRLLQVDGTPIGTSSGTSGRLLRCRLLALTLLSNAAQLRSMMHTDVQFCYTAESEGPQAHRWICISKMKTASRKLCALSGSQKVESRVNPRACRRKEIP